MNVKLSLTVESYQIHELVDNLNKKRKMIIELNSKIDIWDMCIFIIGL